MYIRKTLTTSEITTVIFSAKSSRLTLVSKMHICICVLIKGSSIQRKIVSLISFTILLTLISGSN